MPIINNRFKGPRLEESFRRQIGIYQYSYLYSLGRIICLGWVSCKIPRNRLQIRYHTETIVYTVMVVYFVIRTHLSLIFSVSYVNISEKKGRLKLVIWKVLKNISSVNVSLNPILRTGQGVEFWVKQWWTPIKIIFFSLY